MKKTGFERIVVIGLILVLILAGCATGGPHTVTIGTDGSLRGWGNNLSGQIGDGTTRNRNEPVQIGTDTDWASIKTGNLFTVAVKKDGSLWAWGENCWGQLGDGTKHNRRTPIQIGTDKNWASVSAGIAHVAAIKTDGSLWTWGWNAFGQLGGNDTADFRNTPAKMGNDTDWESVSADGISTEAVKKDGSAWKWGIDKETLDSSGSHTVAIRTDGSLWAWGDNFSGQLGDGTTRDRQIPVQIGTGTDWASASTGKVHTIAIKTDGSLWAWGSNFNGQLGDGTKRAYRSRPVRIGTDNDWASMNAHGWHTVALKTDGSLWAWGFNAVGLFDDANTDIRNTPTQIGSDTDWASVSADGVFTVAVKTDGSRQTWGIIEEANVRSGTRNMAIGTDGSLWARGDNRWGQIGNGSTRQNINYYVQIGTDTWTSVDTGNGFTVAIKSDGSLWAWGINERGQLGIGRTIIRARQIHRIPVQVSMEKWTFVTVGREHTVAIKTDGSLWAWGLNNSGQLGIGTSAPWIHDIPVRIGEDTDWVFVDSGNWHNIALKADGSLWGWGNNRFGQLGDGKSSDLDTPTRIGEDTDWAFIAAGEAHTLAVKTDGTLWAWGWNNSGQLGDGTTGQTRSNVPAQVGTDTDWVSVFAGANYSLAVKEDGSLWAWGNYTRLYYFGDSIRSTVPVQIRDAVENNNDDDDRDESENENEDEDG